MIRDPEKFFGRQRELREIAGWLATMQSVSVVGDRRIGKSSLLYYIAHPGEKDAKLFEGVEAHYLDLQSVASPREFYFRACDKLGHGEGDSHWDLETALEGRKNVVFCLDEFEQAYQQDFSADFLNSLRSLAQTGKLALVVATKKPLSELQATYRPNDNATSNFHNIFNFLRLTPFTAEDIRQMVESPRNGHSFAPAEVEFILKLGGGHPYKLGVACSLVYKAKLAKGEPAPKLSSADFAEIRKEFAAQIAAAMASVSETQDTTRKMSVSVVLALLLLVIAVPIVSFSANASFGPGMFLALLLLLCSIWLLFKNFSWRGRVQ